MSHPLLTRFLLFLVVLLTAALAVVLYYSPMLSLSLTIFQNDQAPGVLPAAPPWATATSPETTYLPRLLEPVDYYRKQTGKNMRKKFVQFLGTTCGIDAGLVESIATLCDHNHNASLVIDDIQDQSLQRRQQPCSHVVYGIPLSLGAAYLDIFRTLHQLPETVRDYVQAHRDDYRERYGDAVVDDSDRTLTTCVASDCYSTSLQNFYLCHLGQQLDIYWTHHRHVPTVDEYLYMIENKTGTLLLNSLGLLDVATGQKRMSREQYNRFTQLIRLFSVFFQIRDDYINVTDPTYWKEKGFCEDFDEKKNSYLLVLFQGSTSVTASTKEAFFDLFYRDTTTKPFTDEEKHTLLRHFVDAGVIDATYNKLLELQRDIQQLMNLQFLFDALPFHKFDATSIVLVDEQKK